MTARGGTLWMVELSRGENMVFVSQHEVLSITVGGLPTQSIWRTPPEQVMAILKTHPEIFAGDFSALAGNAVTG